MRKNNRDSASLPVREIIINLDENINNKYSRKNIKK